MSLLGIKIFAEALSMLQQTRGHLLNMGGMKNDHVDIRLGQMLDEMKDTVKDEFCRLTMKEPDTKFRKKRGL